MDSAGREGPSAKLPVTILSGFLGSGKTTLLSHILRNKQGLRCAVIVNDMAELNIDASLVKNSRLIQAEERIVEMQNGCICCTLREDLVREVGALARTGAFDYMIIESTGISEPMQVAETFVLPLDELSVLRDVATLDTCVTVVDAANLMANFASLETLRDREEKVEDDDDRNVVDLLLDQVEFADVILLNKVDLVSGSEQGRLAGLLRTLNPEATIIPTTNSNVALDLIINTKRFSFEKAAQSAGWLKTLQAGAVMKPETEEYGIGSFVYRARRPFHPQRLHAFATRHFMLQEPDWSEALAAERGTQQATQLSGGLSGDDPISAAVLQASQSAQESTQALSALLSRRKLSGRDDDDDLLLAAAAASASTAAAASAASLLILQRLMGAPSLPRPAAGNKQGHLLETRFGKVLRSKGFVWLASRPDLCGEWSSAGGILRLGVGGPWYCVLPAEDWPEGAEAKAALLKDFVEPHGDRRQELVFIGIDVDREALKAALDACLVSEQEMEQAAALPDPFAMWPSLEEVLNSGEHSGGEEDGGGGSSGELEGSEQGAAAGEGTAAAAEPQPGSVRTVVEGASEVQQLFDELPEQALTVLNWSAPWVGSCAAVAPQVEQLAREHPSVAVITIDLEASAANYVFGMEKVMVRAPAKRAGMKPVLKNGEKFPCFTVHRSPSLQPAHQFCGDGALAQLRQALEAEAAANAPPPSAAPEAAAPPPVLILKKGALEAKEVLAQGKASGRPVVMLWTQGGSADHAEILAAVTGAAGGLLVVDADAAASRANAVLAGALGVKEYPSLQVYEQMRLSKKLAGAELTPAAVAQALAKLAAPGAAGAAPAAPRVPPASPAAASAAAAPAAAPSGAAPAAASVYDPPEPKFAKPGMVNRLPSGRVVHFFPKMPCLRCGCPWWTSDGWEGRCIRCGWDCESTGYDDDSQPLPRFRPKWEAFTAAVKQGRAPAWSGRPLPLP